MRYLVIVIILLTSHVYGLTHLPLASAKRVQETIEEAEHFIIALGKPRKVNDRWQFEQEKHVIASRSRETWQLDSRGHYQDTVKLYQDWVKASAASVLYHCAGRECGSSNVWANEFFQESRLYGPDAGQYYWVLQKGTEIWLLYLIERGNKQVFLQAERFVLASAAEKLAAHNNLLSADCDVNAVKTLLSQGAANWLLLASVPDDAQQIQSIRLAAQCAMKLNETYAKHNIHVLGLGPYTVNWQLTKQIQFELIAVEKK